MASRFTLVSEEKTLKINNDGTLLNTKKETKLGVSFVFIVFYSYIFDVKFSAGA